MDHGACNVVYLDRRAREELVSKDSMTTSVAAARSSRSSDTPGYFKSDGAAVKVQVTIEAILSIFNEVHVFQSGASCLTKVMELQKSPGHIPTILLIDIPYDEEQRLKRQSREPRNTPSPTSTRSMKRATVEPVELNDIYGIHLLTHVSSEIQCNNLSKLVVPVVILSGFDRGWASPSLPSPSLHGSQVLTDTVRLVRYLDCGAVDVLTSPLSKDHVHGLAVHAYRVFKDVAREESSFVAAKRSRKTSWVGIEEAKPYAYLREAMVSSLMSGICNPENLGDLDDTCDVEIGPDRHAVVVEAIGSWSFSAHDLSDDELLHGCLLILEHALGMPELEKWRMPTEDLRKFLSGCRSAYNSFVLYHNFRHVSDVLQAVFYFLVRIGALAPYPKGRLQEIPPVSPIAGLIKPFDALTLLVAAIGHDVGHPGVNNAFLVALNAPLAQLYNDRSVLESFHCAAYSQILRRYWPVAFQDISMRRLMITSILATDMGLHFKYMADLGNLQEKLVHNGNTLDGWNLKVQEEYRDLACGLLIKCADISNVARKFDVAAQWASILTDEFTKQGDMEKELEIPTCLFGGPPVKDNVIKMGESQIGFMNIFARPLFESVTDILPAMRFSVEELSTNRSIWERKIEDEKRVQSQSPTGSTYLTPAADAEMSPSPMSGSTVDLSEGFTQKIHTRSDPEVHPFSQPSISSRRSSYGSPTSIVVESRRSSLGNNVHSTRYASASENLNCNSTQNLSSSRRGSAGDNASLTAILVTQTPSTPNDKKKRDKSHVGCSPRLRSLSPTKRRQRAEKERSDLSPPRMDGTLRGRRYASHSDLAHSSNGTRHFPSPHSQPDIARFNHAHRMPNGRLGTEDQDLDSGPGEKKGYLTNALSDTSTGAGEGAYNENPKKPGRFSRFFKKKWRATRDPAPSVPPVKDSSRDDSAAT